MHPLSRPSLHPVPVSGMVNRRRGLSQRFTVERKIEMARFPRLAAALLVAAGLVVAWSVHAQPPGALPAPGPGVPGGAPESPGKVPGIPPFSLLGAEPVQSELKLTDEQKQRVRDLIAEFDKQARADMTAMQQTAPELQQAKMGQLQ